MEVEEQIFPCKGCGEILEEGKAFELAGNRWHIDCFRCNTCGTLLDSDANLLLLGDGSLICNNCTYSCSACGNKIEDLAILTGDQAFCANCFKCRNCKRKIDNLRYARTSQGIFCMSCHESLMARRRKRSKMPRTTSNNSVPTTGTGSTGTVVLDKSLPALPPHVVPSSAFPPPAEIDGTTLAGSLGATSPTASVGTGLSEAQKENTILPSSIYGGSNVTSPLLDNDTIPITFSPQDDMSMLSVHSQRSDYNPVSKHSSVSAIMRDDYQDLVAGSSRSASTDGVRKRSPALPSQHIASQQKGRQSSSEMADTLRGKQSNDVTPSTATSPGALSFDRTRLSPAYEPPDPLDRAGSKNVDSTDQTLISKHSSLSALNSPSATGSTTTFEDSVNQELRRRGSIKRSPLTSPVLPGSPFDRPARDDSLSKVISRKEVPSNDTQHERKESTSAFSRKDSIAGKTISRPIATGVANSLSSESVPIRSPRRPNSARPDDEAEFVAPRNAPPPPPVDLRHKTNASISSIQSEHFSTGELTPTAEDDQETEGPGGLFRKVSKAVRHGRNHSDKMSALPSQRWKRNGSTDISSPTIATPNTTEELVQLRNKLRFSQQRVTELEAEKLALEERVNGTVDLRQMNTELREKRSTMAFLDTQREMVIRELEVMTDHLSKAKDGNNRTLNLEAMQADVLRDFAASLSKLKDQMSLQIEELVQQKNDVTSQISSLIQMKDKGYQEYEALSTRNTQLSELNNQLIQSIQDMYKQSRQPGGPQPPLPASVQQHANALPPNGLGIYTHQGHKDSVGSDFKPLSISESNYSGDTQVEAGTMLDAPQVVDIRKAKKFNWRKGGQTVAKGLKNALIGQDQGKSNERDHQFLEGARYDAMPAGELPTTGTVPYSQTRAGAAPNGNNAPGSWGAFLTPRPPGTAQKPSSRDGTPNASSLTLSPDATTTLFGSDLGARCTFEHRLIPTIVSRCISEVENRGMTSEGIYRKSGSSSQIKMIQAGFERDWERFVINDDDIDVHAVTSTLKQYFRRLPNPLITFECYDGLLDAVGGVEGAKDVAGGGDEWMARKMASAVERLPSSHRETLEFLVAHLVRVMAMDGENLMTSLNLAVVFAPTIMRPQSIEREMSDMIAQRTAVQCMLEHSRIVFGED